MKKGKQRVNSELCSLTFYSRGEVSYCQEFGMTFSHLGDNHAFAAAQMASGQHGGSS